MEEIINKNDMRTQRNYPMSFRLAVVQDVEYTGIGVCSVVCKYGIQSETAIPLG
ncbi:MAG: hypothetical protein IKY58_02275 [Paludibacteraceae bacterium]|nr:hypothetical protein [Paludibacteraceae bacterium]